MFIMFIFSLWLVVISSCCTIPDIKKDENVSCGQLICSNDSRTCTVKRIVTSQLDNVLSVSGPLALSLFGESLIEPFNITLLPHELVYLKMSGYTIEDLWFIDQMPQLKVIILNTILECDENLNITNNSALTHISITRTECLSSFSLSWTNSPVELILSENKLEHFNMIGNLENLERLDLSNNQLSQIDVGINSPSLKILNVSRNSLDHFWLDCGELANKPNLEIVDYSFNNVYILPYCQNIFKKLLKFNVSHNYIYEIHVGYFAHAGNLRELDISFNNLLRIVDGTFTKLKQLTVLIMSNNKLEYLHNNVFSSLIKLEFLDVSNNKLWQFNYDFKESLTSLKTIRIENNSWICNHLFKLLNAIKSHNITHLQESSCDENVNIDFICCINIPKVVSLEIMLT
ncbi:leucine-rich repeat-containing protein 15-like [Aethina tumida]|uniref:leucine-rich repeat-containing protein 15-like n=1 Tax=Aethina tumida TaxID=116153 RepID=UPI002148B916|nr:leucine-rich repeat-containing protein 15-like [Aethina tumida]